MKAVGEALTVERSRLERRVLSYNICLKKHQLTPASEPTAKAYDSSECVLSVLVDKACAK